MTGAIARYRCGVCRGGYTVYGGQSFGPFFTKYVTRKEAIFDTYTGGGGGCRVGFCKIKRSPGIDNKESISPGYKGWQAGTTSLFLLGSYSPQRLL